MCTYFVKKYCFSLQFILEYTGSIEWFSRRWFVEEHCHIDNKTSPLTLATCSVSGYHLFGIIDQAFNTVVMSLIVLIFFFIEPFLVTQEAHLHCCSCACSGLRKFVVRLLISKINRMYRIFWLSRVLIVTSGRWLYFKQTPPPSELITFSASSR